MGVVVGCGVVVVQRRIQTIRENTEGELQLCGRSVGRRLGTQLRCPAAGPASPRPPCAETGVCGLRWSMLPATAAWHTACCQVLTCCMVLPCSCTAGEYSGLEHEVVPGVVESLKVRGIAPTALRL